MQLIKGQEYSQDTAPSSRQRGCYIKSMTERVQLKKIQVLSVKKLDAEMNLLTDNRQP
jgi:predicted RNA-binding protein YlxR (DUF448 family)